MKARREMMHNELLAEVEIELLHYFRAEPKMIKTRIDDLIAREYIKRDPMDQRKYVYIP